MIKPIDYIYFNGNPIPGKLADGAGIYGMQINVGNSREPTTVSLDVVREDSNYGATFDVNTLSTLPRYRIDLGRFPIAKISLKNLALTAFNINKSPESKTATLTFKDRTIVFDKIHVGVLYKHSNGTYPPSRRHPFRMNAINGLGFAVGPGGIGMGVIDYVGMRNVPTIIPVQCESCTTFSQSLIRVNRTKNFQITYINAPRMIFYLGVPTLIERGYFFRRNILPPTLNPARMGFGSVINDSSGYIILGREQPKQENCETKKCDYNFSELLNAVEELTGLTLGGIFAFKTIRTDRFGSHLIRPLADKNPNIRKDYEDIGVEIVVAAYEDLDIDEQVDETWFFNVVQHVLDPKEQLELAKKTSKVVRVFESIGSVTDTAHPHYITKETFTDVLGDFGQIYKGGTEPGFHGADCYYGNWYASDNI